MTFEIETVLRKNDYRSSSVTTAEFNVMLRIGDGQNLKYSRRELADLDGKTVTVKVQDGKLLLTCLEAK